MYIGAIIWGLQEGAKGKMAYILYLIKLRLNFLVFKSVDNNFAYRALCDLWWLRLNYLQWKICVFIMLAFIYSFDNVRNQKKEIEFLNKKGPSVNKE